LFTENFIEIGDSVSILIVFLSVLLCLLSILCSPNIKEKSYVFLILVLGSVLILAFSSKNIVSFYIFFEISLIPTLILIISWGYQPERLQAGTYIILYTVRASLPLLILLVSEGIIFSSFNILLIQYLKLCSTSFWILIIIITAFLVKLPMYLYHLWLPKAHVEAPLAGSMILAGILLKLGGYGLYLIFKMFETWSFSFIIILIITISLWGGLIASFICLRQTDMKSFVAYSSVAHIRLVIAGVILNRLWGIISIKVILISHGFTSSALFFVVYITYIKTNRRSLLYVGGILNLFPYLRVLWFVLLRVNIAAPPSLNLIGELLILPSLWLLGLIVIIIIMLLILFRAIYNIYLYSVINHGMRNKLILPSETIKSAEYLGLLVHFLPLLIIFKTQIFRV